MRGRESLCVRERAEEEVVIFFLFGMAGCCGRLAVCFALFALSSIILRTLEGLDFIFCGSFCSLKEIVIFVSPVLVRIENGGSLSFSLWLPSV